MHKCLRTKQTTGAKTWYRRRMADIGQRCAFMAQLDGKSYRQYRYVHVFEARTTKNKVIENTITLHGVFDVDKLYYM